MTPRAYLRLMVCGSGVGLEAGFVGLVSNRASRLSTEDVTKGGGGVYRLKSRLGGVDKQSVPISL